MSNDLNSIDRRIIKSKVAMKKSLLSLMKEKEFKNISITEIVQRADLNRGTFYKHYVYKEELLEEITNDVTEDFISSFREPYKNLEEFDVRKLTYKAIKLFEHVADHSSFYTLIVRSNVLSGFQNRIYEVLKSLTLEELTYDSNQGIDPNLLASYHAYAIVGVIIEWVNSDYKYSSEFMAQQLLEIINYNQK